MKGIILAGGSGTRLHPLTKICSKQLLPVYDKPMIYYPLSLLMLGGIRDIQIITTPKDVPFFKDLLGDGSHLGINLTYQIQENPNGLPEAFILAEDFIGDDPVIMILGDNLFYGDQFINKHILPAIKSKTPTVFAYTVQDPQRYGVVELGPNKTILSIEEKPENPKSDYALTGLYIFDNNAAEIAKGLKPSKRGEIEIVDMIQHYSDIGNLNVETLGRGVAWLDTGTHESLLGASQYIEIIEKRQGVKIACLEEIAYHLGYITLDQLEELANQYKNGTYGQYLLRYAQKQR